MGYGISVCGIGFRLRGVRNISNQILSLKNTAKGHSGAARQSAHRTPKPRIGGIAIFSGFIAGTAMLPSDVAAYAVPLLLSCIAVFVGGLGEDSGRDVSPKRV